MSNNDYSKGSEVQAGTGTRPPSFLSSLFESLWDQLEQGGDFKQVEFIGGVAGADKSIVTMYENGGAYGDNGSCILIANQHAMPLTPHWTPATNDRKLYDNGKVASFNVRRGYTVCFGTRKGDRDLIVLYKVIDHEIRVSFDPKMDEERPTSYIKLDPIVAFEKTIPSGQMKTYLCDLNTTISDDHMIVKKAQAKMQSIKCRTALYLNALVKCSPTRKDITLFDSWANSFLSKGVPEPLTIMTTYEKFQAIIIHKSGQIRQRQDYDFMKLGIYSFITLKESETGYIPILHNIIFYDGVAEFHVQLTVTNKEFENNSFRWLIHAGSTIRNVDELIEYLQQGSVIKDWLDYKGN